MDDQIEKAIEVLKNGGTISYPTDTTYGIGCDATNEAAVERVFKAKGRDFNKPLGLAFSSVEMIKDYRDISGKEELILRQLLPGPFMILLKRRESVSDRITAKSNKVGARIPDHKIAIELVNGLRKPIVTTSANVSGEADPTSSSEVKLKVDMIVKGECKYKEASTVFDIENKKILRKGSGNSKIHELFGII